MAGEMAGLHEIGQSRLQDQRRILAGMGDRIAQTPDRERGMTHSRAAGPETMSWRKCRHK